jgi:hypothetical protein
MFLRRRDRARYFAAVVGRDSADPALLAPIDRRPARRGTRCRTGTAPATTSGRTRGSADWQAVGDWVVTEPAEMFGSALAGTAREAGPRQTVTIEPGTYRVRTAYAEPDPETAMVLTQLVPSQPRHRSRSRRTAASSRVIRVSMTGG